MKQAYDRLAVGERLRTHRTSIGLTQDQIAEKIGRVPKYYADIERGSCGMSIETMIALSNTLNMSLDYLLYGKEENILTQDRELLTIMQIIQNTSPKKRNHIIRIIQLLLDACTD